MFSLPYSSVAPSGESHFIFFIKCYLLLIIIIFGLVVVYLFVYFYSSSLSSSLSALSAITWRDLIEGRFKKTSEFRKALVTKFLGRSLIKGLAEFFPSIC